MKSIAFNVAIESMAIGDWQARISVKPLDGGHTAHFEIKTKTAIECISALQDIKDYYECLLIPKQLIDGAT